MGARYILGLDIGSNSVGSAWIDLEKGSIDVGLGVFPAGVDETDDKRGEPKNAKRRMTRRTRITLARRSLRKRELRLELIARGLLPADADAFKTLLEETDPWTLRRKGLDHALTPHEFGRVLVHLAQRRGALGIREPEEGEEGGEDGKVKKAIGETRAAILARSKELGKQVRTFGELIDLLRAGDEKRHSITTTDSRSEHQRKGPREWRDAVRNRRREFQFHADRAMIRDEFAKLWIAQRKLGGTLGPLLTDELRTKLDDESGDSLWRHRGLLFGQRRQSWDMGTLGRCALEPAERCAPHADRHTSYFRVIETVNNIRILEGGNAGRPLSVSERTKIITLLRGPLGVHEKGAYKGKPKRSVSVTDIRAALGLGKGGKTAPVRLNIEADEDREINTDWFHRAIVHGGLTEARWNGMDERQRESVNKAVLNFDPDRDEHAAELRAGAIKWWSCTPEQADGLVTGWRTRPPLEKRGNLSRRAIRNMLAVMDAKPADPALGFDRTSRWYTQIEARKVIAEDGDFTDATTGEPIHPRTRDRYATGAKGLTARDRHYIKMHPDSLPPAPMLTNPVVRKAIHEVRRHIVEHIKKHGRKPDAIVIELAREAKMSAKDSDRALFRNRLRDRIRKDIIETFNLHAQKQNQQRAAVERVVLAVQQKGVCPLCGNQTIQTAITPRMAAEGEGCELAHIIPRGIGGSNGLGNMVLSHIKCNRNMGRRTPRDLWGQTFDAEINRVEQMYTKIDRVKPKDVDKASEDKLWGSYFDWRDDDRKIANFKKAAKDIQGFSDRDLSDTRYATRQVMAYLADALYEGKGLPERGGERKIFTTDGGWTGDIRREWGLFQDTHHAREKGTSTQEEHARREKNRGDHRHHALDAIVVALTDRSLQTKWEQREMQAEKDGINTADRAEIEKYRELHPLPLPGTFKDRKDLRDRAMLAVFGDKQGPERPVSHRAVKRKLIGAFHEETLLGPVVGRDGELTGHYTGKKSVLALDPNHLRVPRKETAKEAIERLSADRKQSQEIDEKTARKWARATIAAKEYVPSIVDPSPGNPGIVRDRDLRRTLRECLESNGLNPDDFTANQIKKLVEAGKITQKSGVPIRSVVLLRAMSDPVIASRWEHDHATGVARKTYDAITGEGDLAAARAYKGGNNHHIEYRVDEKGKWSGDLVTMFVASQRKLALFRSLRKAGVPRFKDLAKLPLAERKRWKPQIADADRQHPLIDRTDHLGDGGRFVMSLCEGEMVKMRHKETQEVGYFVVAKINPPRSVVLVPHWDARTATERKDSADNKVRGSERESFTATPDDLKTLAPPGHPHALKVRVSPLGMVTILEKD